jgi:hypothetical protein
MRLQLTGRGELTIDLLCPGIDAEFRMGEPKDG